MNDDDIKVVILKCSVGCLHHVVGITYFKWNEGDPDEPEMYFETLHEPYENVWMRIYRAFRFVVFREPLGVDSSMIGPVDAGKLIGACSDYIHEWNAWNDHMRKQRAS
jgi:hypothetical protein